MFKISTAVFLLALLVVSQPASSACLMMKEAQAFDYQALQSSMMVGALSCNQQKEYNAVLKQHHHVFSESGNMMRSYFRRVYGDSSKGELNRFMTRLANRMQKQSMEGKVDTYCAQVAETFHTLLGPKGVNLTRFIEQHGLSSLHGLKRC